MATQQLRQVIQAEFRRQQLMLDKEALALLVDYVAEAANGLELVHTLIDKLDAGDVRPSNSANTVANSIKISSTLPVITVESCPSHSVRRQSFPHNWCNCGGGTPKARQRSYRFLAGTCARLL